MPIFREIPPTAGWTLSLKNILEPGSLEQDFKNYLGSGFAQVTYSGTAAFYLILESLKTKSSKKSVVIPSFICPLVPLAIKRAGLKVLVCDIRRDSFDFDQAHLENICADNHDILAIVAVHLGGIPVGLEAIKQAAQRCGAIVIEDCAQASGASYKGKRVGTLGDWSFFSLCRGRA